MTREEAIGWLVTITDVAHSSCAGARAGGSSGPSARDYQDRTAEAIAALVHHGADYAVALDRATLLSTQPR